MSDAMMADFNRITDSFSGEELVSAISILTEKLKKVFVKDEIEKKKNSREEMAIQSFFARADAEHFSSNGVRWTREEMNGR
nr:hypothetical protein [Treponema sp.]